MTPQELRDRTKKYAIDVARIAEPLLGSFAARDAAEQLARASAAAAANYRAACVARSPAEFTVKIGLALEECDESVYWLELLAGTGRLKGHALDELMKEGRELTRILGASKRTSRRHLPATRPKGR